MKQQFKYYRIFLISIAISLLVAASSFASVSKDQLKPPAEGNSQLITFTDGSTLHGRIIKYENGEVTFESTIGTSTFSADRIADIEELSEGSFRNGEYWFQNPNRTRLYIGPTGRLLEKGDGYFSDVYLFFPSVAYGISDNITIGGGITLFPGLNFNEQLIYFTPKIGISATEKMSLAVSALIIRVPDWGDSGYDDDEATTVGVIFGVGTYGTDNNSITAGLGFGYEGDEIGDKPVVILGGERRLSRRVSFVTENWILPGVEDAMISYGFRFMGDKLAVDLSLLNTTSNEMIFPGVPYLGFVWNF